MYEKPVRVLVQVVVGEFDDDGNQVGERVQPVEQVFHPFGTKLQELIQRQDREAREMERSRR